MTKKQSAIRFASRPGDATALMAIAAATLLFAAGPMPGAAAEEDSAAEGTTASELPRHLSEALRASIKKVLVLPGRSPASQSTTGSYEKQTKGLLEGGISGSQIGSGVGTEIGPVAIGIPFPILTVPGAIIGGIAGKTQREIQEFRDALTDDLAKAASQPLGNDALASDVFWGLRRVPGLDSRLVAPTTPIPADTDAILYVSLADVTIDVQGKDAIITTTANATLRRLSDGRDLYEQPVQYQDRDTLSNWNADNKSLWHDYTNFARHYFGREIAAETFDRVELRHELRPKETSSVARVKRNDWTGVSKTLRPTLAWELKLLGGDGYGAWAENLEEADIDYDVEVYDRHRLVYSAKQVPEPTHTLDVPLEACKQYRWSVRPSYRVGAERKFGEWMRFSSETDTPSSNIGRKASDAPAYIQDFASLKIRCGSR